MSIRCCGDQDQRIAYQPLEGTIQRAIQFNQHQTGTLNRLSCHNPQCVWSRSQWGSVWVAVCGDSGSLNGQSVSDGSVGGCVSGVSQCLLGSQISQSTLEGGLLSSRCQVESPCVVGGSLRFHSTHMDVDLKPPLDTRTTEKESKWKCSSVSPSLLPLKSVINDWETT